MPILERFLTKQHRNRAAATLMTMWIAWISRTVVQTKTDIATIKGLLMPPVKRAVVQASYRDRKTKSRPEKTYPLCRSHNKRESKKLARLEGTP